MYNQMPRFLVIFRTHVCPDADMKIVIINFHKFTCTTFTYCSFFFAHVEISVFDYQFVDSNILFILLKVV